MRCALLCVSSFNSNLMLFTSTLIVIVSTSHTHLHSSSNNDSVICSQTKEWLQNRRRETLTNRIRKTERKDEKHYWIWLEREGKWEAFDEIMILHVSMAWLENWIFTSFSSFENRTIFKIQNFKLQQAPNKQQPLVSFPFVEILSSQKKKEVKMQMKFLQQNDNSRSHHQVIVSVASLKSYKIFPSSCTRA